ncbi:hypothetical protein GCM10017608_27360 [Agromyces luteolus]|nr:hypothetical protein [Agromyces luteolus]GLK28801.1 hypothetical protein GCM10017608_27360 [Agromyces luteolus]
MGFRLPGFGGDVAVLPVAVRPVAVAVVMVDLPDMAAGPGAARPRS